MSQFKGTGGNGTQGIPQERPSPTNIKEPKFSGNFLEVPSDTEKKRKDNNIKP
jgi:hypothetical protein